LPSPSPLGFKVEEEVSQLVTGNTYLDASNVMRVLGL